MCNLTCRATAASWYAASPDRRRDLAGEDPDYADALERLHAGMRKLDVRTPHFTDRVKWAQRLVESSNLTPDLATADRDLLITALRSLSRTIVGRGAAEQLLHGELHPGQRTEREVRTVVHRF
jgi:hypothetical protein